MKSDISRQTFDQKKHYSQVIMQQGRVQLDADWNEQQDILAHRIETSTRDIIGQSGVPQDEGGFQLKFTPGNRDLLISPGRIYVDGILCELDATSIKIQDFDDTGNAMVEDVTVDGRAWEPGQWVELLTKGQENSEYLQISSVGIEPEKKLRILTFNKVIKSQVPGISRLRRVITYHTQPDYPRPTEPLEPTAEPVLLLAYLDVWQRHITAIDDAHIHEVALGDPDTATRIQTLWQVKIIRVAMPPSLVKEIEACRTGTQNLSALEAERQRLKDVGTTAAESQTARRLAEIPSDISALREREEHVIGEVFAYSGAHKPDAWTSLLYPSTGKLNVTTADAERPGYRGVQNELYHVEIHEVTANHDPFTFKWARNNASTLARVEVKGEKTVMVAGSGPGGILNFNQGQFVEVVNEETNLLDQPGKTARITRVDTLTNQLTLDATIGSDGTSIKIRLWDGINTVDQQHPHEWLELDSGIKIQFSEGVYHRGDYWFIPARTSTEEVEWPPYETPNTHPIPQLSRGVRHHYTPLAHILLYQDLLSPRSVHDNRRRFAPMPAVVDAIHIVKINWQNDAPHSRAHLKWNKAKPYEGGLQIHLDAEPDSESIKAETLIVTLERKGEEANIILHGNTAVKDKVIYWHWKMHEHDRWADIFHNKIYDDDDDDEKRFDRLFKSSDDFVRVTVTLKGHAIWCKVNERYIHLDGQAFGQPGRDRHTERKRIDLAFPSGAGARASDFESWFYIRE